MDSPSRPYVEMKSGQSASYVSPALPEPFAGTGPFVGARHGTAGDDQFLAARTCGAGRCHCLDPRTVSAPEVRTKPPASAVPERTKVGPLSSTEASCQRSTHEAALGAFEQPVPTTTIRPPARNDVAGPSARCWVIWSPRRTGSPPMATGSPSLPIRMPPGPGMPPTWKKTTASASTSDDRDDRTQGQHELATDHRPRWDRRVVGIGPDKLVRPQSLEPSGELGIGQSVSHLQAPPGAGPAPS